MTSVVNDWIVKLKFDSSAVVKGKARVDKMMSKMGNNAAMAVERQNTKLRQQLELEKKITAEKRRQGKAPGVSSPRKSIPGKGFSLQPHQEIAKTESIDAVVRKTGRELGETSDKFKQIERQAQNLKRQLRKVGSKSDLARVNGNLRRLRENAALATSQIKRQNRAMTAQRFASTKMIGSLKNLAAAYVSVFAVIEGGRQFFRIGEEFDSLNASLLAAGGSALQAGKDFKFIENQSQRLGFSLLQSAKGWQQIGAAGRASNLTMEETREVWLAGTEAARAFGLSSQRLQFVHLALSQMISKGKVSMEELRRQLGESLPGAMSIAAKAMGTTTQGLEDMMEKGIAAEEFLPKFSKALRENVRDSGALAASMKKISAEKGRLRNALELGVKEAFDVGAREGTISFLKGLTNLTKDLIPLFKVIGVSVNVVGKGLGFIFNMVGDIVKGISFVVGNTLDWLVNLLKVEETTRKINEEQAKGNEAAEATKSSWEDTIVALRRVWGLLKLIGITVKSSVLDTFDPKVYLGLEESRLSKDFKTIGDIRKAVNDSRSKLPRQALDPSLTPSERLKAAREGFTQEEQAKRRQRLLEMLGPRMRELSASKAPSNEVNVTIEGVDTNNTEEVSEAVSRAVEERLQRTYTTATSGVSS